MVLFAFYIRGSVKNKNLWDWIPCCSWPFNFNAFIEVQNMVTKGGIPKREASEQSDKYQFWIVELLIIWKTFGDLTILEISLSYRDNHDGFSYFLIVVFCPLFTEYAEKKRKGTTSWPCEWCCCCGGLWKSSGRCWWIFMLCQGWSYALQISTGNFI